LAVSGVLASLGLVSGGTSGLRSEEATAVTTQLIAKQVVTDPAAPPK
jgi:hypothetical protein